MRCTILATAVFWAAVPVGLLIINILVVNNTRDIATDAAANKRTLAVLLGLKAMKMEYLLCLLGAYLIPMGMWAAGMISFGGLLTWLSIPQAIRLYREFSQNSGRQLNKTLAGTAQLALVYAVLFSLGIIIFK